MFLTPSDSFAKDEDTVKTASVSVNIADIDFTMLKHTDSGRIDKIIDGHTLLLKNGTIIRLASIYSPDFHIWEDAVYSQAAFDLLKDTLPENTEIKFYQSRNKKWGQENRMGHRLGHVMTKNDKVWLQGLLLAKGLAHVKTAGNSTDLLSEMYDIEDKARKAKIGLWADDSRYKAITASEADNSIGNYAIIEGRVKKIATIRNVIYLNFGADWKSDFTIMIPASLRREFAKEGVSIMNMTNKEIRVRGNLRDYNGPLIALDNIADLEILPANAESSKLTP